ncbi:MAG: hypothetical protein M1366_06165 [Patescibacteria group bacterium]|nr:hypothetical protein [Patescibacteria group bacterium]
MSLYFVYPFILGVVLSFVWSKTKNLFQGKSVAGKAANFGFTFWFLTSIPGMWITYSSFPVSFLMIASWSFSSLVQVLVGGLVISRMGII